jgi:uncharacterized Zn-finger protein
MSQATDQSAPEISVTEQISVASDTTRISCDGGGGALGHPQIWLNLKKQTPDGQAEAICPYCSRHFVAE